jgi:hypothetical protein
MVGPSAVGPSAGSHSNAAANNAKQIAKYPKYKKPRPFPNPPWRRAHDNAYAPCSPLKLSARRVAPLLHSRIPAPRKRDFSAGQETVSPHRRSSCRLDG